MFEVIILLLDYLDIIEAFLLYSHFSLQFFEINTENKNILAAYT